MSNKELVLQLIDNLSENKLGYVVAFLQGIRTSDEATFYPNHETAAAMLEAERIAGDTSTKGFTDVDEFLADLRA